MSGFSEVLSGFAAHQKEQGRPVLHIETEFLEQTKHAE
ncbi:hypothetical protein ACVWYU_001192 [Pseudomonas sp. TE12234]